MKTVAEREGLEGRIERLQSELDSIADRKGQLAAEAAGLEAKLPELQYHAQAEHSAEAKEAITNAQARLADIAALAVGFDWRREEVGNQLMALDVELSGKRHAAAQARIREATKEIDDLIARFTRELLVARVTCEVIGQRSAELAGLEVVLKAQWGGGKTDANPFPWNRWATVLGRRVNAFFRFGSYTLSLDSSDGQSRELAMQMLKDAGIKLLAKQVVPGPDRARKLYEELHSEPAEPATEGTAANPNPGQGEARARAAERMSH